MNNRKTVWTVHIVFWLFWFYSNHVIFNGKWLLDLNLFKITFTIVSFVVFYINYLVLLPLVFKKFHWAKVFFSQIGVFFIFSLSRYFTEQILTKYLFDLQNYYEGTSFVFFLFDNFYFGSKVIFPSIFIFVLLFAIHKLEQNNHLIIENKIVEVQALKSQINPHFLFNALNNIYALVQFQSKDALKAIEKLSELMRFSTYESQKETIYLKQEIEYMQAMIVLEKFRYKETNIIDFVVEVANPDLKLPPFLLSPFLENAFKHGILSTNSPIKLILTYNKSQLSLNIINTISEHRKDETSGIGLENVKKRLDFYYPNKYQLDISEENNTFSVKLMIDFL